MNKYLIFERIAMRRIQAPDIEINEFDRSQYGRVDHTFQNAPVCLMMGFADKGEDYNVRWVDSMQTFEDWYGFPATEAEKYLYNCANEVIGHGARCLIAKLPYYNKSKDKYVYTSYQVEQPYHFNTVDDVLDSLSCSYTGHETLKDFLFFPDIDIDDIEYHDISSSIFKTSTNHEYVFSDNDSYEIQDYFKNINDSLSSDEKNIMSMLDYLDISLQTIEDMFQYISETCEFDYFAQRIFKYVFYKSSGVCRNDAVYRLKTIYECNGDYEQLKDSKYFSYDQSEGSSYNWDNYKEQIESMMKSFNQVEGFQSFDQLLKQFFSDHTLTYFKTVYETVKSQIESINENNKDSNIKKYKNILLDVLKSFDVTGYGLSIAHTEIPFIDKSITNFIEITSSPLSCTEKMTFDQFDGLITGVLRPEKNKFYIVDKTRTKYGKIDVLSGNQSVATEQKVIKDVECLGIVPVVYTATNAMIHQGMINDDINIQDYNAVSDFRTADTDSELINVVGKESITLGTTLSVQNYNFTDKLASEDKYDNSLSEKCAKMFPSISMRSDGYLERDNLKKIGIAVFKAFKDVANHDKIGFTLLENFVGSLDRNAEDPITHENIYIGNIIHNNSEYIEFFSNVTINDNTDEFDTYLIHNQTIASLGFYEAECVKNISVSESISKPLSYIFERTNNRYSIPLDLVLDAGISNIAQFIRSVYWQTGYGKYDFNSSNISALKNCTNNNTQTWKSILQKFDNFVKNVRKDCIFLADGLRQFALVGKDQKRVRRTAKETTVMKDVVPNLKFMNALDSSYSAGYCNWFLQRDAYTGDLMWMPPTIKTAGVYAYTDVYHRKWDAPAGVNRGSLQGVFDVSFNPNQEEAGKIYNQQWNYAISFPIDGIVVEGQKTFQKNKTALDRVNVRRLMLYLEKMVIQIGRRYLYEGNTEYLRQRFVDEITVIFEDCMERDGIVDYAIKCDNENNTPTTIDNNELHIKIAVKPVKTIEFIVCDFIVTNQSADVTEEIQR